MDDDRYLGPLDTTMVLIDDEPRLRAQAVAVLLLDGPPDLAALRHGLEAGTRAVHRLRERVVRAPLIHGAARFVVDETFDLDHHFRVEQLPGGDERALLDRAAEVLVTPYDPARPLWDVRVVEGLGDGRAALLIRMHHAVTDGVGGFEILTHLVATEPGVPEEPSPLPRPPAPEHLSRMDLLVEAGAREQVGLWRSVEGTSRAVTRALRDPVGSLGTARDVAASLLRVAGPVGRPLSTLTGARSLDRRLDSRTIPLEALKRAAHAGGGTLNDALVAVILGGLQRYHAAHGERPSGLRMYMPVNLRDIGAAIGSQGGNDWAGTRTVVPLQILDPADRIAALGPVLRRARAERGLPHFAAVAEVANRLPTSLLMPLYRVMAGGLDFVASNIPGPRVPLYVGGARIESLDPFGPIASAAVNFTAASYVDRLHLGVNSDPAAVTDVDGFLEGLDAGIDEVLAVGRDGGR